MEKSALSAFLLIHEFPDVTVSQISIVVLIVNRMMMMKKKKKKNYYGLGFTPCFRLA